MLPNLLIIPIAYTAFSITFTIELKIRFERKYENRIFHAKLIVAQRHIHDDMTTLSLSLSFFSLSHAHKKVT